MRYDEVVREFGNSSIPQHQLFSVVKFFVQSANYNGKELWHDKCLVEEWLLFSEYLPHDVVTLYLFVFSSN